MDYNEQERFETVIDEITERLSYIILDIINMSLDKLNDRSTTYFKENMMESDSDIDF